MEIPLTPLEFAHRDAGIVDSGTNAPLPTANGTCGATGVDPYDGNPATTGIRGAMYYRGHNIADLTDGTSNTVMVGEVFRGKSYWNLCGNSDLTGFRCFSWVEDSGFCASDTSRPPNSKIRDEVDWADSMVWSVGASRPVSSKHSSGAQVLMADGSSRFVSENIDYKTWRAAGSTGGGEVPGEF